MESVYCAANFCCLAAASALSLLLVDPEEWAWDPAECLAAATQYMVKGLTRETVELRGLVAVGRLSGRRL